MARVFAARMAQELSAPHPKGLSRRRAPGSTRGASGKISGEARDLSAGSACKCLLPWIRSTRFVQTIRTQKIMKTGSSLVAVLRDRLRLMMRHSRTFWGRSARGGRTAPRQADGGRLSAVLRNPAPVITGCSVVEGGLARDEGRYTGHDHPWLNRSLDHSTVRPVFTRACNSFDRPFHRVQPPLRGTPGRHNTWSTFK